MQPKAKAASIFFLIFLFFQNCSNSKGFEVKPSSNTLPSVRVSATTPTPTPAPTQQQPPPAPAPNLGSSIPLPSRLVATYHPLWTGIRITEVPTSYNQIYLFHARPQADGSGIAYFEFGYAVNAGEIATVRNRGQRVVLTFGGANFGFNFSNRTQSQNFVNSIIGIINSLGGKIDGLDFNNFEANVGSSPTEMVWIAQQMKAIYGTNFSISCPPAPDGNYAPQDRAITKAMANASVLDYAGPQYYDYYLLVLPETIERWTDEWVAHFNGDASKVAIGFGANYSEGSSLGQVQQAWTTLKAKYPRLRGAFGWSSETDRNAGWTFGNYLGNNK
jgi:chitinase